MDRRRRGGRSTVAAGGRGRRRGRLVGLAVALVAAAACMVEPVGGPADPDGQREPAEPTAEVTRADGTDTVEEFRQDVADAQRLAELYWADQFEASGQSFRPIRRVVPYQRDGEVSCGGQEVPRNNAVYCTVSDYIAYDINWSFGAFRQIGDAFVFYLLGHEYAHGIQTRLGIRYNFTIQQELQADCMAGAFLGDSVRAGRLTLEEGDLDEFNDGLLAVGDDPGQPWFAEGSHGTPEQRTEAFFRGYERSLSACDLG
ncbi:neutral zinc metallopeptidase [Micromonospora sp. NPDC049374]|uniref:neutral zinc metallopeptidase n=1 Tax=Micromonospora sp. NPDC049374 TaxID=3154352 RepID=UPI0034339121